MSIESGYDKVWKQGCRDCNYLNFGCGHHEDKPKEGAPMSILKDSFKAQQTTYEFSPEQIKLLVPLDLGVASERVSVEYVVQENRYYFDRLTGGASVTKIRVVVK